MPSIVALRSTWYAARIGEKLPTGASKFNTTAVHCPSVLPNVLRFFLWCCCCCVCTRVSGSLHPGVVQKAERFVAAAQLKLASSLPRDVMGRLRVVVHTHTEVEVSACFSS